MQYGPRVGHKSLHAGLVQLIGQGDALASLCCLPACATGTRQHRSVSSFTLQSAYRCVFTQCDVQRSRLSVRWQVIL